MGCTPRIVDIIWNITQLCPWDCSICCVDAVHVRRNARSRTVALRTHGLSRELVLPILPKANAFSIAGEHYQAEGLELTLQEKIRVVEHLEGFDARLDISGGDPLILPENWKLLEFASRRLGKSNITVTATGGGLHKNQIEVLSQHIGEFNFTYDPAFVLGHANRPPGYADSNIHVGSQLARKDILTRAELPLTISNCSPENLRSIYLSISEAGIHRLLLMRLFPVGRGAHHSDAVPSRDAYVGAIRTLRDIEQRYGKPSVHLQCALRHLESTGGNHEVNPCDLLSRSFGLMADGTLLLSPWAIGPQGQPLANEWILGNLARSPLAALINDNALGSLQRRLDDNFGHCKVFAYLNSDEAEPHARLLDNADPLFAISRSHDTEPTPRKDE